MGQIIQHSLHKHSIAFFFFFKAKKVISPNVICGEQPRTDVAVISQEHLSWGA